ncbi:hypothetical protein JAAARDRAFT_532423 [Jaapia argillacea MUCL 33604]|uniref:F-box domain-containing protein n=1 Tax=Jaapia argillacea MUCL 33604 TaxID=933084 RepID=A0A067P985_9AGAM|nr:hypothetical protein JAAARDRAFT_532423 [Jaapia argillacea MUCL 33604]
MTGTPHPSQPTFPGRRDPSEQERVYHAIVGLSQQAALEYLIAQEQEHLKQVAILRSARNSFNPIHRLPIEVVLEIFSIVAETWYPRTVEDVRPSVCWLALTHVCHYWRELALNTPTLWTTIDVDLRDLRWTRAFLERSQNTSLDLRIVSHEGVSDKSHQDLLASIVSGTTHRLGKFKVFLNSNDLRKLLLSLENLSAPQLESLEILCSTSWRGDLVSTLFGNQVPHLRSLILDTVTVSWDSPLFKNLTYLSIAQESRGSPETSTQFLECLRNSPLLEGLRLTYAIPPLPQHTEPTRRIDLPRLRSFFLSDEDTNIGQFLPHLSIPGTCNIRFLAEKTGVGFEVAIPPDCHTLGPTLSTIRWLQYKYTSSEDTILLRERPSTTHIFSNIGKTNVSFHNLEMLSVVNNRTSSIEDWHDVFSGLPGLTSLEIRNCFEKNPLSALRLRSRGGSLESGEVVCPRLHTFAGTVHPNAPANIILPLLESWKSCFTYRASEGSALTNLRVLGKVRPELVSRCYEFCAEFVSAVSFAANELPVVEE